MNEAKKLIQQITEGIKIKKEKKSSSQILQRSTTQYVIILSSVKETPQAK